MFPLGFMLFVLLEMQQWRNHETSENICIGIKQAKFFVDMNIQSQQSISLINCHSQFRSTSAFTTFYDAGLVTLAHILSTSPLFVSFAIFRTGSKVKKGKCFGKSSVILKSFLNWRNLHFLYILK